MFLTIQSPAVYSLFKLSQDINWSRNVQPMIKRWPRFCEKSLISKILLSFVQLRPVDLLRNSHCWLGNLPEQSSPNRNPQSLQSQDILVAGERNRSVGLMIIDLGTGTDLNPPACGPTRIPPYEELHVRCGGIYLNYAHPVLGRGFRIQLLLF